MFHFELCLAQKSWKLVLRNLGFVLSGLMLCTSHLTATNNWQQRVNYNIKVTLDDENHRLQALSEMEYINNSPDVLNYLFVHLYPNAYKHAKTDFARQALENGSSKFHNAFPSELGGVENLSFVTGDKKLFWTDFEERDDVVKVELAQPLFPGDTVVLKIPFEVQIPKSFSRLGRVGQSYQITQWFPKAAMYDKNGWHPMSYMDMGEFYSNFGAYDVSITLPENYVVGATGKLQNVQEKKWLGQMARETARIDSFGTSVEFPPSSTAYKTLRYVQDSIHDFAWFADKRFHVLADTFQLKSGKEVVSFSMFTNQEADLWQRSPEYLRDATIFYSEKVGDYPFEYVTAVQSALSAGAGMEYPMITVIGRSGEDRRLENVIVHEVGHNWFYGILASNERTSPWLDEGINTYYDTRYDKEKYGDQKLSGMSIDGIPRFLDKKLNLSELTESDLMEMGWLYQHQKGDDQPICTHSEHFSLLNYGLVAYGRASMAMRFLEHYLTAAEFDRIMQLYYEAFSYNHPNIEDIYGLFKTESTKSVDWFFQELLNTTEDYNYGIKKVSSDSDGTRISIKNHSNALTAPFQLSALKNSEWVKTEWIDGFVGEQEIYWEEANYDAIVIDAQHLYVDPDRRNNYFILNKKVEHKKKNSVKFLADLDRAYEKQLFYTPLIGFNRYDGLMAGIGFYNSILPNQPFEWVIAPMWGFNSKKPGGLASFKYRFLPKKIFRQISVGMDLRSFTYGFEREGFIGSPPYRKKSLQYYRLSPYLTFNLRNKSARSSWVKEVAYRYIHLISTDNESSSGNGRYISSPPGAFDRLVYHELSFSLDNKRTIHPYALALKLRAGKGLFNAELEASYRISFVEKKKGIDIRFFGGYFFENETEGRSRFSLSGTGRGDYSFDELYFGRTESDNLYSNQVHPSQGGFKLATGLATLEWMAAFNVESDIPKIPLPVRIFLDIGFYPERAADGENELKTQFMAGAAVSLFRDRVKFYYPLLFSEDIKSIYDNNSRTLFKLTWQVDLKALDPLRGLRNLEL